MEALLESWKRTTAGTEQRSVSANKYSRLFKEFDANQLKNIENLYPAEFSNLVLESGDTVSQDTTSLN